jgi:hypothetical protein
MKYRKKSDRKQPECLNRLCGSEYNRLFAADNRQRGGKPRPSGNIGAKRAACGSVGRARKPAKHPAFKRVAVTAAEDCKLEKGFIERTIASLEREKILTQQVFDARIDGLNEELGLARDFERLTQSIGNTLDSILFGANSAFTGVEQSNLLQGRIADLHL